MSPLNLLVLDFGRNGFDCFLRLGELIKNRIPAIFRFNRFARVIFKSRCQRIRIFRSM